MTSLEIKKRNVARKTENLKVIMRGITFVMKTYIKLIKKKIVVTRLKTSGQWYRERHFMVRKESVRFTTTRRDYYVKKCKKKEKKENVFSGPGHRGVSKGNSELGLSLKIV